MSKIQLTNKGEIQSVSLNATTGMVTAFVEEDRGKRNLVVKEGRKHLDLMANKGRGEILGRFLDVADGGGFTLVFPALSKPPTEA